MLYHTYELTHAAMAPLRVQSDTLQFLLRSGANPLAYTPAGKLVAAGCDVFESVTRRYGKPEWGIAETVVDGARASVREETVLSVPFCDLVRFVRDEAVCAGRDDPKVLIVAPMSGHYATLLRGTVRAMLPEHDVYVTDWRDARLVPLSAGTFDLNDFIDHVIRFLRHLGPDTHVIAVCQPSVPVLAATALMAEDGDHCQPASITLMGGPIDTRRSPTAVNHHALSKSVRWFKRNVITRVPYPHAGAFRRVYPGFVQLSGFMAMNLDRHMEAHLDYFMHLVEGDCDSAEGHEAFYEEYLSVMDLPAEFFLQTVRTVFQDHDLPEGRLMHRGRRVDCSRIVETAVMTVEGEKDDICGLGQTAATHDLCRNVPSAARYHYEQPGVGHYGVFNGRRWRTEIQPRIRDMIRATEARRRGEERCAA